MMVVVVEQVMERSSDVVLYMSGLTSASYQRSIEDQLIVTVVVYDGVSMGGKSC